MFNESYFEHCSVTENEVFACACIVAAAFVSKVYAGHRKRAIHRDVDIFEQLFIGVISIDL